MNNVTALIIIIIIDEVISIDCFSFVYMRKETKKKFDHTNVNITTLSDGSEQANIKQ